MKLISGLYLLGIVFLFMPVNAIVSFAAVNVSGTVSDSQRWMKQDSPYVIDGMLTIEAGASVEVEAGVEIRLKKQAGITILGTLNAFGTIRQPVRFGAESDSRWAALSFEGKGNGTLQHCEIDQGSDLGGNRNAMVNAYRCSGEVIIDNCTFTNWPDDFNNKATQGYQSAVMEIRYCYFGEGSNEAVHGVSTPVLVEHSTFARRSAYRDAIDIGYVQLPAPRPVIRFNMFLGSDDDAIDLDACDAWVEGNVVMNCRGGNNDPIGISGDLNSKPVIVNNLIINCESGIGFKNGAEILVVNNTIVNCDRGIWLHQNPAFANVKNTIIWGQDDQNAIVLEPGSEIDVSYSIIQGDSLYLGEGNLNQDPQFVAYDQNDFRLTEASPAVDAGIDGAFALDFDIDGNPREQVDMGAYEFIPVSSCMLDWSRF